MENFKQIVDMAVDAYKGNVKKYSSGEALSALREALIEANNGSTKLDYRAIRDGKCNGLFSIVEEILKQTVWADLENDAIFKNLVDVKNIADGDENRFVVDDGSLFFVDEVARGNQAVRRQRLGGYKVTSLPMTVKMVRIYEELSRILAGNIDFNEMIDRVGDSFRKRYLNDVYTILSSLDATALGGAAFYPVAGSYNEGTILDTIANVEAAAQGKTAMLVGTKVALRPLMASIKGDTGKDEIDRTGYAGTFFGSHVLALPQRYAVNADPMGKKILILATDSKPIKMIHSGSPLVIPRNAAENMDLTQEYVYAEETGVGVVMAANSGIGIYETT